MGNGGREMKSSLPVGRISRPGWLGRWKRRVRDPGKVGIRKERAPAGGKERAGG